MSFDQQSVKCNLMRSTLKDAQRERIMFMYCVPDGWRVDFVFDLELSLCISNM